MRDPIVTTGAALRERAVTAAAIRADGARTVRTAQGDSSPVPIESVGMGPVPRDATPRR